MDFIDEKDDALLGILDFFEDGLETLLELSAVFCTSDEGAHVEREESALETDGHVLTDDTLGETFDNGGFANTGFTRDERQVKIK
jgi:hypothetical protein